MPTPPSPTPLPQTGRIFQLPSHQVPLPLTPTMTTKPTELCIAAPEHFDGAYSKTLPWLMLVLFYLEVNKDIYNTDSKKIAFTLSYMTKGSTLTWTATFRQKAIAGTTITMGTFHSFVTEFKKSFEHHNIIGNAIAWLSHKCMTSKSNGTFEPSLPIYISGFQNHITQSKITDHNVLISFFSTGIPSGLMKQIYSMETIPITINDWYKKALTFQTHYKRAQEVEQRRKNPSAVYRPFSANPSTPTRDPNAMDVDAIKVAKLTKEERECCMKEGLCLRC